MQIKKTALASFGIAVAVLSSPSAYAAKPLDGLRTLVTSDGAVVFVRPRTMDCISGGGKSLDYDWTMTTMNDTVSLTFSIVTDTPVELDSIRVVNFGSVYAKPLEKLYVEPKGRRWEYRMRAPFSIVEFSEMSEAEEAPLFELKGLPYRYRAKKWPECKAVYKLAMDIIKENKK